MIYARFSSLRFFLGRFCDEILGGFLHASEHFELNFGWIYPAGGVETATASVSDLLLGFSSPKLVLRVSNPPRRGTAAGGPGDVLGLFRWFPRRTQFVFARFRNDWGNFATF
jgi:hypothetical protein